MNFEMQTKPSSLQTPLLSLSREAFLQHFVDEYNYPIHKLPQPTKKGWSLSSLFCYRPFSNKPPPEDEKRLKER